MTMILDRTHAGIAPNRRRTPLSLSLLAVAAASIDRGALQLLQWFQRSRERRQLLGLSDRALQDFGASRCDADREGSKPFWLR